MTVFTKLKKFFPVFVFLLIIPAFLPLLKPGFYSMQDDLQVFRLYEMDKCFSDFQFPCRWVPDAGYGYGYPQFNFYAPGVYYLGELIHLLGFQYIDSIKILFVLGFMISALGMFILVKEFFGEIPAVISAFVYTYAPFKAQEVYVRGAISEFWGVALLPFILWFSYKFIKEGGKKNFLGLSLSISFLLITHNLLPLIFFPVLLLWILYFLWSEKSWGKLPITFLSVLMGFLTSSFFLLPLILEKKFVHSETLLSGYFDYRRHFVDFKQMFFSNTWGYGSSDLGSGDDLALSSGRVLFIGGILGIVFAVLKYKKQKKVSIFMFSISFLELAVLFMMHLRSSIIWETFPILQWLQFPWRFLGLSTLLLGLLMGGALYFAGKFKYFVGAIIILLVFVWHGSFFKPKGWFKISDQDKLSGASWEKQLTVSIGDYLPIYAEIPPNEKAKELPEILDGEVDLASFNKESDLQEGIMNVTGSATVRLQLYDFPGMVVYVDGNKISHKNDDCRDQDYCFGLISFNLNEGRREFRAVLGNTKVRSVANLLSVVTLAGLICVASGKNNEKFKKIFG